MVQKNQKAIRIRYPLENYNQQQNLFSTFHSSSIQHSLGSYPKTSKVTCNIFVWQWSSVIDSK